MINQQFVSALAVGVGVMCFIFIALTNRKQTNHQRKALGIASGAVGIIVAMRLNTHTDELDQIVSTVTDKGVAVLLAAIAAALIFWKIKSLFS